MDQATPAEIRLAFLFEFTKRLILSTKPSLFDVLESESKKPMLEEFEVQQFPEFKKEQFVPSARLPAPVQVVPPVVQAPIAKPLPPSPPLKISAMGKIMPLIQDPSVISIDCTEANKPLTVNRNGLIQQTNVILSEDEIRSILNEISQKTRIPLNPGVFKVAYQNFLLTAFVSEFVGTRFLIQKRAPGFLPTLPGYQPSPYKPIKF